MELLVLSQSADFYSLIDKGAKIFSNQQAAYPRSRIRINAYYACSRARVRSLAYFCAFVNFSFVYQRVVDLNVSVELQPALRHSGAHTTETRMGYGGEGCTGRRLSARTPLLDSGLSQ